MRLRCEVRSFVHVSDRELVAKWSRRSPSATSEAKIAPALQPTTRSMPMPASDKAFIDADGRSALDAAGADDQRHLRFVLRDGVHDPCLKPRRRSSATAAATSA